MSPNEVRAGANRSDRAIGARSEGDSPKLLPPWSGQCYLRLRGLVLHGEHDDRDDRDAVLFYGCRDSQTSERSEEEHLFLNSQIDVEVIFQHFFR